MAFNFPNTPAVNQIYPTPAVVGQPQYRWNGYAWAVAVPASGGYVEEAPVNGQKHARKDAAWEAFTLPAAPDVNKAYVDAQNALKYDKVGGPISGVVTAVSKGHQFGTFGGMIAFGALTQADANILLYTNGPNNWAGFGTDGAGNVWCRTGLAGTPAAAFYVDTNQFINLVNNPTAAMHVSTKQYVDLSVHIAGECYLYSVTGAVLQLGRSGGTRLFINGKNEVIPAAGVNLAPPASMTGGMSGTRAYWIYAFMNAGVMTLEASPTLHVADATYGHRIKQADPTRTLVGASYLVGANNWATNAISTASWFNPVPKTYYGQLGGSISATTPAEAFPGNALNFINIGNRVVRSAIGVTRSYQGLATADGYIGLGIDSTTDMIVGSYGAMTCRYYGGPGADQRPLYQSRSYPMGDGWHFATPIAYVSSNTMQLDAYWEITILG